MNIFISAKTDQPIYDQIREQIEAMILDGQLKEGESLPSMRSLSKSLRVSVITVQRAYEELQREGWIETSVGRGSFVCPVNQAFFQEEQLKKIEKALDTAAGLAKKSHISLDELIEILKLLYKDEHE